MTDYLLGFDVGGGSTRALLFDVQGHGTTVATRRSHHPVAPDTAGLGRDVDLPAVFGQLCETTREVLARAGARPEQVIGVAASGMRFATVVLGCDGEALLATPNRDARAGLLALQLGMKHGEALHARSGHWPSPICGAPRLAWLEATAPGALDRADALLGLGDWITWRLTGVLVSEPSQAPATLLWDVAEGAWAWDWIERLGLPRRMFREILPAGRRAGPLLPEVAAALGLPAGLPIGVCSADTPAALLGAGVMTAGEIGIVAGTTSPVQLLLDTPRIDPAGRLWTEHHAVSHRWALESNAGQSGEALAWLAGLLHPGTPRPVARLLAEAAASEPGAAGLLSSFGAELMNARDLRLPVGTLTLCHLAAAGDDTPRRHLARAVLEGMACALRANVEQVEAVAGRRGTRVALAGGLSRSRFFAQLVCDVLERPIEIAWTAEASALGAALCAGVAAGAYADLATAAGVAVKPGARLEPDADRAPRYAVVYANFQGLHARRTEADAFAAQAMLPAVVAPLAAVPAARAPQVRPRIVVTADLSPASLASLAAMAEVDVRSFRDGLRLLAGPDLVEALHGAAVFVTEIDVLDAASLAALPALRAVVACRGDAVNVDVEACTAFGVPVLHAPGRNADAVADLCLAFLLSLARRLPEAGAFLRQPGLEAGDLARMGQAFRSLRGRELWGKRVGLVGFGAVVRGVALRLQGFGVDLCVHDPFLDPHFVEALGAEAVSLDRLLRESDFVSLHAPLTTATRGFVDAGAFARMKPGAALVNTARAALVDEAALVAALRSGRLSGAALDVFSVEPPGADHPLLGLPNVIATPHVGGNTEEVAIHQGAIVVDALQRLLSGRPPPHVLNPETLADFDWAKPRRSPDAAALARLLQRGAPAVTDLQRGTADDARSATSPAAAPSSAQPKASFAPAASEGLARVLRTFCAQLEVDAQVRRVARGRSVTLQFAVPDAGLEFFLRLYQDAVHARLGRADGTPDVRLRMKARVLDSLFTGQRSGMELAMQGELFFTGDAARAMTLQHLQADLQRVYGAAREAAGGLGHLDFEVSDARPNEPLAIAEADPRLDLLDTVRWLHGAKLITATGGNVSVRAASEDALWITPTQLFKGDLRPEWLVRIDLDGEVLDAGTRSPSSERLMHCAAYRARPDAGAVVHAHAPHATILANAGLPFLPISTEAAFFGELPRIPFVMPGTKELADSVAHALRDSWAVLMQNHGLLVAGRSLRRAADMVEIIERTAEVLLGCRAVGREPPLLPEEVVRELRQLGDLVA